MLLRRRDRKKGGRSKNKDVIIKDTRWETEKGGREGGREGGEKLCLCAPKTKACPCALSISRRQRNKKKKRHVHTHKSPLSSSHLFAATNPSSFCNDFLNRHVLPSSPSKSKNKRKDLLHACRTLNNIVFNFDFCSPYNLYSYFITSLPPYPFSTNFSHAPRKVTSASAVAAAESCICVCRE